MSPAKAELRREVLARRDAIEPAARTEAAGVIAGRALPIVAAARPSVVGFYWPIRSEVDPRPLAEEARRLGATLALPAVMGEALVFRRWRPFAALVPARFGLSEPEADAPATAPDFLIVPLAGFDRAGHRLGYGRGYYDRAIAALTAAARRPRLLGLAFAAQECARIPAEPHDERLDWIVTEREAIEPR